MANPIKLGVYRTTTVLRALIMLSVDAVGYLLLFPYTIFRRIDGRNLNIDGIHRIALLRLDGIGDVILSTGAIAALRRLMPDASITLYVSRWAEGLSSSIEGVDKVVALDAPQFMAFKGKFDLGRLIHEFLELRRAGRDVKYDLVIDLRGDFLSIIYGWALGGRWLAARGSRAGGFLLSNLIRQKGEGVVHEVELNMEFLGRLFKEDLSTRDPKLRAPSSRLVAEIKKKFQEELAGPYICLSVAAPYLIRRYPVEKWGAALRGIREYSADRIIILGSPSDVPACDAVVKLGVSDVISMAGKLSLEESAAVISGCQLFIGVDGGLIHIASALGRPLIQLFGPGNPQCFGYSGKDKHVLRAECLYNPCAETRCKTPGNWCMDRIRPEEIVDLSRQYLQ